MHTLKQPISLWIRESNTNQTRIVFRGGNNREKNLLPLDQNTKALFSKRYLKPLNNHIVQFGTKGFDGFIIAGGMNAVRKKDDF